jgi:zinc protease
MAVIAVGDFDPDSIQAEIQKHFAQIRNPAHERPRPRPAVPGNAKPLIGVASDKEATGSLVELVFKRPAQVERTVADFRRGLMESLYFDMLNDRFQEIAQKPNATFLNAGASVGNFFARGEDAFTLGASVADTGVDAGLQALLTEAKRADKYGFLESEFNRAKIGMLRGFEAANAERDKTESGAYVGQYIDNFLTGEAIPSIGTQYELARRMLPNISLHDVNAMASEWVTDSNRVLVAEMPQKPGVKVPSTGELLAIMNRAATAPVSAYTETLSSDALIANLPPAGSIVARHTDSASGVTEWKLSNGARVLIKPTDFKADEVLFSAYAPGGTSLAPDSDVMSAGFASTIVQQSGLGEFNSVDLAKKLRGKVVSIAPSITETNEGLAGSASPKDLETLLQLAHLEFTSPRLDTAAFKALSNQIGPFLANRGSSPDQVFSDTVQVTMSQHSKREPALTPASWAQVSPETALHFFRDRFADAGAFTFVFVGNVNLESLAPLVERYLASLPSNGHAEAWRNMESGPPKGVVERTVRMGTEPKATTVILFTGP